ncbi:MAG: gliding motility protein GldL [Bacteroidales bacterium]|nr:gliding motility protein GldL [Bacteroidales bacterium]
MGLNNIVRSKGFRNFMSKLYGWGAALVILGALFKINHYPYADIMLIVGLGTEAIIFFFSAFEPPHVEPDWSLVHPELAHMYHDGKDGPKPAMKVASKQGSASQQLDKMLDEAKIGPELIQSLGDGLRKFSDNATHLADVTTAAVASKEFVSSMKGASASVNKLTETSGLASEILEQNSLASKEFATNMNNASRKAADLTTAYVEASATIKGDINATGEFSQAVKKATLAANELSQHYTHSAEQIAKSAEMLDLTKIDGSDYNTQLKKISTNLSALNTVYELQLKSLSEQIETSSKLQGTVNQFVSNVDMTAENMNKYRQEVDALTKKISALNNVYGNMLTAMNVNPK